MIGGDVMHKNIIGERMRIARSMYKPRMSQQGLLARLQSSGLDITQSGLSKIENGQRAVTDIELIALAEALNVSVLWLLNKEKITI